MIMFISSHSKSASMASFPVDWQEWPVVARHKVYSADTVLPDDASLFDQESVYSYTWINGGQGSPLTIRVHPDKFEQYRTHGPYTDGITVIAVAESGNLIWVTEHVGGFPIYGSYDFNGEDISDTHLSLDPDYCHACHYTYKDICINGTCFTPETKEK
ncbi:hypothetical protein [Vibrio algarum]|uniref:Uncharacterized protein n=1 Tax=Vibrio algarum TaxID=3020714 RepID=A0ABT4YSF4_9VIBR|nr:hypothetical protein [Vibrio sp. KJ40-1]MDB1123988.1 hypothetical protein [Vibrio sp. KJ40-1]